MGGETLGWGEIIGRMFIQFTPVWIALAATFALSSPTSAGWAFTASSSTARSG